MEGHLLQNDYLMFNELFDMFNHMFNKSFGIFIESFGIINNLITRFILFLWLQLTLK